MKINVIPNKTAWRENVAFSEQSGCSTAGTKRRFFLLSGLLFLCMLVSNSYSGAVGFGSKATGGAGGKEVTVTSATALKAAAESAEAMIITVKGKLVHNVSGGDDDARIFVKSNKTIQGADKNASVDANFDAVGADNVIFRNITLSNEEGKGTGDGIEFTKGCTNIWIDHVTFAQCKDGALDFKKGSDNITVSWCKFAYTSASHKHNYANLIGHNDSETGDRGKLKVTMHHNWYAKNVIERMPRVRYGQVHVFNNYYSSDRTNYVIGVGKEAQVLLEGSYFKDQGEKTWYDWGGGGKIQWTDDNIFAGNTRVSTWAPNSQVFKPPYTYTLDKTEDIPGIVSAGAGVPGGSVLIKKDNSSQTTNGFAKISNFKTVRSRLDFQLKISSNVNIVIYNNMGKKVADVIKGYKSPGNYSINLESYGLSQGVYYADVHLNSLKKKFTLVKY